MTDTPQLTIEQKLTIREMQLASSRYREQSRQLLDRATQIDQQAAQFINKSAADLAVDVKSYTFDLETLTFQPILVPATS